ncbi:putative flavoenzyme [Fictibacillus macauensis ZFHKF-1]|uniref:Putative flavoenzyme n=1 Tax=Fictibacillus macauensis ZFHKF-1 TaxID=1196324 RepID=I8AH24_9BACL|nr:FMN-binding glutamate synthase family protein [Fictibacillus macauensis]EIT84729.1 putative flavoenzyme [Fictibacillus macauensis ZFHKF-1]
MTTSTILLSILLIGVGIVVILPLALFIYLYIKDDRQQQHAILRNFPVLGKIRYVSEKVGPEFRQYLFNNDNEGKPFSRKEFENIVKSGKYKERIIGFGSLRDFQADGFYIRNTLFPKLSEEMNIDHEPKVHSKVYEVDGENLFARKEHRKKVEVSPYYLKDEDAIILGDATCRHPFVVKGMIGQSGMSYGALGENAILALSHGLALAGGTWMNTGEGGLSQEHLDGGGDLIMQIGPGLFGVRDKEGNFSWEEFKKKSDLPEVKAFELKLGQGAKTRGGHVEGNKVTKKIAEIRMVEPGVTINSPNRFKDFNDVPSLFQFIEKLREVSGKPIGMKIVVGDVDALETMVRYMKESNTGPDFITIDGGEGGTGATYQELADSVGFPIHAALPIIDELLKTYGIRHRVKLIASGKLASPDHIAIALAMGADLINIARGFMINVGCIMAQVCHTNQCPVGVATTDPKLQKGLSIEEKKYRVCNYVLSLREGLFNLAAAAGIDSPTKFSHEHIAFKDRYGRIYSLNDLVHAAKQPMNDVTYSPTN